MVFQLIPFLSFAIPTSITPGPNNISAMAFSLNNGYKKTLPYIFGIFSGTFVMMLICAGLSYSFASIIPEITIYLKYIGAAYILYLAYKTLEIDSSSYTHKRIQARFYDGAILQLVNPKAIFYGMTVYSTFFNGLIDNKVFLLLSALGIAIFTFTIVSTWAIFGSILHNYLKNKLIKKIFLTTMAIGLIYAAIEIALT